MRPGLPRTTQTLAIAAALWALAAPAGAQTTGHAGQGLATRTALQERLELHQWAASSTAYSPALQAEAAAIAESVRERLARGDFQPGDRIWVRVEGQPALTDTFTVATGQRVQLPEVGAVPLVGVLRSELQETIDSAVHRFVRNPSVVARSLIRVSVTGGVASPGFHVLDSEAVLSDVFMVAGGLVTGADLAGAAILRGDRVLIQGEQLALAIAQGRTLDQIGLRAGDRVNVPTRAPGGETLRNAMFMIPTLLSLATFFLTL
jgi:protein involved in polysaccharide export with SLBB domain